MDNKTLSLVFYSIAWVLYIEWHGNKERRDFLLSLCPEAEKSFNTFVSLVEAEAQRLNNI